MRLIAVLLLLANVGVLAWLIAGEPGSADSRSAPPDEIGDLVMLADDAADEAAATEAEACYTIGPFDSSAVAGEAADLLAERGIESETRVITDEEVHGYQVYLPPAESREEAVATTAALAERDIHDYFIMTDEDGMEHAISLGLFSEQEYAGNHMEFLRGQGFDPELRLRTRERNRYWQDFADPDGRGADVLAALDVTRPVRRLAREC